MNSTPDQWPVEWPRWKIVASWFIAAILTVGLAVLLLAASVKWLTTEGSPEGREIVVQLSGASVLAAGVCISLSALMNIRIRRRGIARVSRFAPGGSSTPAVAIQSAISVTRVFPLVVAVLATLAGALGVTASAGNWTIKGVLYVLFWATWTAVGIHSITKIVKTRNPELFFTIDDISVGSRHVRWDDIADVKPALRGAYPVIEVVWHRAGRGGHGSNEGVLTIHPVRYHLDSLTMLSAIHLLSQSIETRRQAINSPDYAALLFSRGTASPVST